MTTSMREGFCSLSGGSEIESDCAPPGYRAATISTHVAATGIDDDNEDARSYLDRAHECMRATRSALAPQWEREVLHERTASPRTFERFTGRYRDLAGGIPKRVGRHNARYLEPRPALEGLWLVADAIFPGQSTFAEAIGGFKLAQHIAA
jgi:phytoene dehydrogenase-like protein